MDLMLIHLFIKSFLFLCVFPLAATFTATTAESTEDDGFVTGTPEESKQIINKAKTTLHYFLAQQEKEKKIKLREELQQRRESEEFEASDREQLEREQETNLTAIEEETLNDRIIARRAQIKKQEREALSTRTKKLTQAYNTLPIWDKLNARKELAMKYQADVKDLRKNAFQDTEESERLALLEEEALFRNALTRNNKQTQDFIERKNNRDATYQKAEEVFETKRPENDKPHDPTKKTYLAYLDKGVANLMYKKLIPDVATNIGGYTDDGLLADIPNLSHLNEQEIEDLFLPKKIKLDRYAPVQLTYPMVLPEYLGFNFSYSQIPLKLFSRLLERYGINLKELNLENSIITPDFFEAIATYCPKLAILNIKNCNHLRDTHLQNIATHCPMLTDLNLENCKNLTDSSFMFLAQLPMLKSLTIYNCSQMTNQGIAYLTTLENLETLNIPNHNVITSSDIGIMINCKQLKHLDLHCDKRTTWPYSDEKNQNTSDRITCLIKIKNLESLNLNAWLNLTDENLSQLATLKNLKSLSLVDCNNLKDIAFLANLTNLESLVLPDPSHLIDITPLEACKKLKKIICSVDDRIFELLTSFTNLQELGALRGTITDNAFKNIIKLTKLHTLKLSDIHSIHDLSPLKELTTLKNLELRHCVEVANLEPLAAMTRLESLNLQECEAIQDFSPLAQLTNLQSLNLEYSKIKDISPLATLTKLQSLHLRYCSQISDSSPLKNLTKLQELSLGYKMTDATIFDNLTNLESLDLAYCNNLENLNFLTKLKKLRSLTIEDCKQVSEKLLLEIVTNLQNLSYLNINGCRNITKKNIRSLADLPRLESLIVSDNSSRYGGTLQPEIEYLQRKRPDIKIIKNEFESTLR